MQGQRAGVLGLGRAEGQAGSTLERRLGIGLSGSLLRRSRGRRISVLFGTARSYFDEVGVWDVLFSG